MTTITPRPNDNLLNLKNKKTHLVSKGKAGISRLNKHYKTNRLVGVAHE
jgi:hypothetical protein